MLEAVTLEALAVGDEDAAAQLAALAGASGNLEGINKEFEVSSGSFKAGWLKAG